jgi:PilZ domain
LQKSSDSKQSVINRENRYTSHALVEYRKFKYLPLNIHSAVLLDISLGGFKIEFTSEKKVKTGEQFWLHIPLTPLGIYAPARLICRGECRWFDTNRYRLGGIFTDLSKTDRLIIDQIVDTLKVRGSLTG